VRRFSWLLVSAYVLATAYFVSVVPRNLPLFLLFMGSVGLLYYFKVPGWYRATALIVLLGVLSVLTGIAIYKPVQFSWLTALFGGFQAARYWHFWTVWLFVGFSIMHVVLVFVVDPSSLRAMVTGWYRGRFPSHG